MYNLNPATKALNNGGAVNMHREVFGTRRTVNGRPMWRDQYLNQSQTLEPAQLGTPMTVL
jgi:hypothetical protein